MCVTTDGLVTSKRLINLKKSSEIIGNVVSSQPDSYFAAILRSILCIVFVVFLIIGASEVESLPAHELYVLILCFFTMTLYAAYLLITIVFTLSVKMCQNASISGTGARTRAIYALTLPLIQCAAATALQIFVDGLSLSLSWIYVVLMLLIILELYVSLIQFNYLSGAIYVALYNILYLIVFEFAIQNEAEADTALPVSYYITWIVYCIVWHFVLCYFKNYILFKWFTSSKISINVNTFEILNNDNNAMNDEYCTIVMGSCTDQKFDTLAVYQALHRELANIVLLLGDNIYADLSPPTLTKLKTKCCKTKTKDIFKEEYDLLLNHKDFRPKAYDYSNQTWLATWDDHDYGENDAARGYSEKLPSKRAFIEFVEEIVDTCGTSEQVTQQLSTMKSDSNRGTYYSYDYRQDALDLRMRIIMLDTRFDRDPDDADIVGAVQWQWLRQQVTSDADDDIDWYLICNGSPILNEGRGGKKTVGQQTRDKLFAILNEKDGALLNKTVLLSGDLHYSVWHSWNQQLYEFTSSSITHSKQWFCCKCQYKYLEIDEYTMAKEHNGNGATEKSANHCKKNSFGVLNINKNKLQFCVKDAFGYSYLNVTHQKK